MSDTLRILGVGTMRTGASLVNNILSVHPDVVVFAERVHFFRFILDKYDPLTPESAERMLHHLRIRMETRFGTPLDVDAVHAAIIARGVGYNTCYDEIMKHMVAKSGKRYWGDFAPAGWRNVPYFVNAFPGGRAYHIYRDPRGVLASWKKMTFQPDNLYLNGIFNWIDSIQCMKRYQRTLPAEKYLPLRFEVIHEDPEKSVHALCDFMGLEFSDSMLRPERWEGLFDPRFVEAPASSHSRKKVYGFDPQRTESWRGALEEWEVALIEYFLGDLMDEMGYARELPRIDPKDLRHGMSWLTRSPITLKHLIQYMATGEGTDQGTNDPTDPRNWGGTDTGGFSRFVDSPEYEKYLAALAEADEAVGRKYAAA